MALVGTASRRALMVGNWKMSLGVVASVNLAKGIADGMVSGLHKQDKVMVGIAPSAMGLPGVARELSMYQFNNPILVGGQNFYAQRGKDGFVYSGAFTGETSLQQLVGAGARFSILGHSETRDIEGYGVKGLALTDVILNERLKAAMEMIRAAGPADFFVIFCVGETLTHREAGAMKSVLRAQIEMGLDGISGDDLKSIVIAYEPVWAIGTGKTASATEANDAAAYIRSLIQAQFSADAAEKLIIQYGGSMNPKNVKELLSQPDIDGGLIGGAALKVEDFLSLISQAVEVYHG